MIDRELEPDSLAQEVRAALKPSADDKEDILSLVKRKMREAASDGDYSYRLRAEAGLKHFKRRAGEAEAIGLSALRDIAEAAEMTTQDSALLRSIAQRARDGMIEIQNNA